MNERRIGRRGDGGKWVCDPACMLTELARPCVVVSIGSNNDFSFETGIVQLGCTVHTFDHTVAAPQTPPGVVFHSFGLGVGDEGDSSPLRSLDALLALANISEVDVLKMDIEGAEYAVLHSQATLDTMRTRVRQLLVEFHFGWGAAQEGPVSWQRQTARALMDSGFVVFHKEPNIQYSDGSCIEYALLNHNLI